MTAKRNADGSPSQPRNNTGERAKDLADSVRRHRQRRERSREGRQSFVQNLALVGSLGWSLVVPMLAGAFIGHYVDRRYHSGVLWSATCIFVGAAIGGYFVWERLRRQ